MKFSRKTGLFVLTLALLSSAVDACAATLNLGDGTRSIPRDPGLPHLTNGNAGAIGGGPGTSLENTYEIKVYYIPEEDGGWPDMEVELQVSTTGASFSAPVKLKIIPKVSSIVEWEDPDPVGGNLTSSDLRIRIEGLTRARYTQLQAEYPEDPLIAGVEYEDFLSNTTATGITTLIFAGDRADFYENDNSSTGDVVGYLRIFPVPVTLLPIAFPDSQADPFTFVTGSPDETGFIVTDVDTLGKASSDIPNAHIGGVFRSLYRDSFSLDNEVFPSDRISDSADLWGDSGAILAWTRRTQNADSTVISRDYRIHAPDAGPQKAKPATTFIFAALSLDLVEGEVYGYVASTRPYLQWPGSFRVRVADPVTLDPKNVPAVTGVVLDTDIGVTTIPLSLDVTISDGGATDSVAQTTAWNGLTISTATAGKITLKGTPLSEDVKNFRVFAKRDSAVVASNDFTVTVTNPQAVPALLLSALPEAVAGQLYEETVTASVSSGASLSSLYVENRTEIEWNGLTIRAESPVLSVSGRPEAASSRTFKVTGIVDSGVATSAANLTILVGESSPGTAIDTLHPIVDGSEQDGPITIEAGVGHTFSFSLQEGNVTDITARLTFPDGTAIYLSVSHNGSTLSISVNPTQAGEYTLRISYIQIQQTSQIRAQAGVPRHQDVHFRALGNGVPAPGVGSGGGGGGCSAFGLSFAALGLCVAVIHKKSWRSIRTGGRSALQ
ncbi:MAG: hypothetical protein LBQ42_11530 [Synergistaceae bacterium]|jgi:hypothetical protein|nr:hypothetical protein [Synergistaceae bacterium]